MIAFLLLACPKSGELPPPIALTLPIVEPPPRPNLPVDPLDCLRAEPMAPGDIAPCAGVLVGNARLHELRLDQADLAFWEDAAQDCRRYRETDLALCDGRIAMLQAERDALVVDVRQGRIASSLSFPSGVAVGSAVTIAIVYGVTRALADRDAP